jgi:restriction endonuclease Mrr
MAIPDTESLILPTLQLLSQRSLASFELQDAIAEQFGVTAEERAERFPNSKSPHTIFANRVAFALKN